MLDSNDSDRGNPPRPNDPGRYGFGSNRSPRLRWDATLAGEYRSREDDFEREVGPLVRVLKIIGWAALIVACVVLSFVYGVVTR
jgi:hypothetical protein